MGVSGVSGPRQPQPSVETGPVSNRKTVKGGPRVVSGRRVVGAARGQVENNSRSGKKLSERSVSTHNLPRALARLPRHLKAAATVLTGPGNASQKLKAMQQSVHSPQDLKKICDNLSKDEFNQNRGVIMEQLQRLEVDFHMQTLAPPGCSTDILVKSLCQQQVFNSAVFEQEILSETANYMRSHLTDPSANHAACELLARLADSNVEHLRMGPMEFIALHRDNPELSSALRAAKKEDPGGAEVKSLEKQLTAKLNPQVIDGVHFSTSVASAVGDQLTEGMMARIPLDEHDAVRDTLADLRSTEAVKQLLGKSKSPEEIANALTRFEKGAEDKSPEELMGALLDKSLKWDTQLLGKFVTGDRNIGQEVPGQEGEAAASKAKKDQRVLSVARKEMMSACAGAIADKLSGMGLESHSLVNQLKGIAQSAG